MFLSWILPLVLGVVKVYLAPDAIICQLKLVYHLTLGTNSRWGLTVPILWRPRLQGGQALSGPEIMNQAASLFVSMLKETHKFLSKPVEVLTDRWATTVGVTRSVDNLPYI